MHSLSLNIFFDNVLKAVGVHILNFTTGAFH
ncbi:hypothetical protein ATL39_2102 [Sinobaca qinghaiensis]|uniref:Uncharacterized protein n=1 Tax=Sinobaca qinghaiensis TaxID=342944 RepID=A0A419V3C4_9BACL|nr:hypothetical protein ATL39_2102 [Sinobaca qinghaiensis]